MHKKIVNELRLDFAVKPEGPLLIKSGREAGADPTRLDMSFVRTQHGQLGETVYLPGSSLKGVLRSYCEKIARTVGAHCCDPLGNRSCGRRLERRRGATAPEIYRELCSICRIFGHTVMASHLHISDAYPLNPYTEDPDLAAQTNRIEERDGVAIDRVTGAVAVGPFQLETVTQGAFHGQMYLKNFQIWQVGLLAVALRDMAQGRVPLGFAKSRGLGRIRLDWNRLEISYPGQFGQASDKDFGAYIYGVTAFDLDDDYGFTPEDPLALPAPQEPELAWGRATLTFEGERIEEPMRAAVSLWGLYATETGSQG